MTNKKDKRILEGETKEVLDKYVKYGLLEKSVNGYCNSLLVDAMFRTHTQSNILKIVKNVERYFENIISLRDKMIKEETKNRAIKILEKAVDTLKNSVSFMISFRLKGIPKKYRINNEHLIIGFYNRFDEIGLIYADLKGVSFNQAIKDLNLVDIMKDLDQAVKELKNDS